MEGEMGESLFQVEVILQLTEPAVVVPLTLQFPLVYYILFQIINQMSLLQLAVAVERSVIIHQQVLATLDKPVKTVQGISSMITKE